MTPVALTAIGSCGKSGSRTFAPFAVAFSVVVEQINACTFGTAYRESSLETVVHSIAEQRQIFRGADHAFLWKPQRISRSDIFCFLHNQPFANPARRNPVTK